MSAVRWTRTEDDASEVLTLVRLDTGDLAIQITTGPETGDDFVGLYNVDDGDQIPVASREWTVVGDREVTPEQIEEIAGGWENGTARVERIAEVAS